MRALVLAEHDNAAIAGATLATVTAAAQLGAEVDLLVAGHGCDAVAQAAAAIAGITRVLHADAPHLEHPLAENLASLVVAQASPYSHLLAPASTFGKNLIQGGGQGGPGGMMKAAKAFTNVSTHNKIFTIKIYMPEDLNLKISAKNLFGIEN